ncbi:class I SAM-dependent methyltransferase [Zhongshania aliphaticivorans]|uniref:class I SAM-dependent methyltransferase n=1 Tax=Zhongshania aliphaticivorans TaxID=1470434 RepID=UPI001330FD14|nr:class I SAM-dependent methyltransferase [Zhongshania aliphaticivorans]
MLTPVVLKTDASSDALAQHLDLSLVNDWSDDPNQVHVFYHDQRLVIGLPPVNREHPVAVDFELALRKRHPGKELLLKAIGGSRHRASVVDATAGLGRDSFLLASHGCTVTLCERMPVVAALLADGLRRAEKSSDCAEIASRMQLHHGSGAEYLASLSEQDCPDVVYLDPMFPVSGKSALVKKEMRLFHSLVGLDQDSDALLEIALQRARHRVVVKRPPKAPYLAERKPQLSVTGKAVRFDIYPLKAFPKGY